MTKMIGHDAAEGAFAEAWRSGRLHHAWLLCGPQQMGKAAFAQRLARFLLTRPDGKLGARTHDVAASLFDKAGDPAALALLNAGTHPELLTVRREPKKLAGGKLGELARNITIDQIRAVNAHMRSTIVIGVWRVVIIDAVDDLEAGAANALLKTLEEPPRRTLFLLISHAPGRLLPTIRSRCRILRFQPLGHDVMQSWLHQLRPLAEAGELARIADMTGGVPGRALHLLEGGVTLLEERLTAIATSGDGDGKLRSGLAQDLGKGGAKEQFDTLLDIAPPLLARLIRSAPPQQQAAGLAQWPILQQLTREAVRGSYDTGAVSFAVGSCFAAMGAATRPGQ